MSEYTPTTEEINDLCLLGAIHAADGIENLDVPETAAMIDRWLAEHDAVTRAAALEEAATLLEFPIGVQVTNGVGWIPTDSRAGAARYLRHLARNGGTP